MKVPFIPAITGKLLSTALAILLGWAVLVAVAYLVARPLLPYAGLLLGAAWVPTARVALEGLGLGAAGFAMRRLQRDRATTPLWLFALTLAVWNFGALTPDVNVPWLLRLTTDAAESSRYWDSWLMTLSIQALLFGSIFAGAGLAGPGSGEPLSIRAGELRR